MNGLAGRGLRVAAIVVPAVAFAAILASAGSTLGYDYQAYVAAGDRVISALPLYDTTAGVAGGFVLYLYPPPFALGMVPFALLPAHVGLWLWILLMTAAFLGGVAALPVSRDVRWVVLLLGGINWPVLYGLKLGQVSALLFLLFALSWRWIDRQAPLGFASAVGAVAKLQPGLLVAWMALTGRVRGALVAIALIAVTSAVTTVALGMNAWADYLTLLGKVSAPVTTPHNFTPGAVAYQLGVDEATATSIQLAATVIVVAVFVLAARYSPADVSLLATVTASQLLSPLLWDHYAVMLLLPVAWLIAHGNAWAALVPIATSLPLVGWTPAAVYPISFGICLVAPILVARREGTTRHDDSVDRKLANRSQATRGRDSAMSPTSTL